MKKLYLIGGTMGVGKTATCQQLKSMLSNAVLLDGDWCWDADPFVVTDETKAMVMDNICHVLNNLIRCSAYDNVLFCWVMHERLGRDFSSCPLIPTWSDDTRLVLIGHSFGGATVRLLSELLAHGDEQERAATAPSYLSQLPLAALRGRHGRARARRGGPGLAHERHHGLRPCRGPRL